MKSPIRVSLLAVALCLFAIGSSGDAQLEGSDRGIAPIDSASSFEVTGIDVDVTGPSGQQAREEGYRLAQAKGWRALWAKTNGKPLDEAPSLSDSQLDNMVSGIVVEQEQVGPHRYIATLGVLFDRARTSDVLGVGGVVHRSAPMLVIPVMLTGSTFISFEYRNPWQAAWARFRTGNSPVDYVRPVGNGIDPLLLNEAQTHRPGRAWWRTILDQYGASDVVIPEVHLERLWPGGPAIGIFIARKGPDNQVLGSVTLRIENSAALPKMLDEGVRRLDAIYAAALDAGQLKPDPTLAPPPPPPVVATPEEPVTEAPPVAVAPTPTTQTTTTFSVQVDTPDAAAVSRAELAASHVPGVTSVITTSLALGGTSVMRVTFQGDSAAFQAALKAQGWQVRGSGTTLRISKGGGD